MRARWIAVLSAALVGSCFVPISDVEDDKGSGGSSGSSGAAGNGATGATGATGGAWSSGGSAGDPSSTGGGTGDASAGSGGGGSGGAAGSSGGMGGSAGSAGSGGVAGSGGTPVCTLSVADDFADGALDAFWGSYTSNHGILVEEVGGQLRFVMPASVSGTTYQGVQTKGAIDLTGCATFVQVADVMNPATKAYTAFVVRSAITGENNDYVEFLHNSTKLVAKRWLDGAQSALKEVTYDSALHAWWRIRESGGTLHFETSSDGVMYQSFASTAPPFDPTQIKVALAVGTYQPETSPGDARFDNFNVPP